MMKKCSPKGWCAVMNHQLESEAHALRGLSVRLKHRTETCVGVIYRKAPKSRGIMLNYCPWCGTNILWEIAA